MKKLVIHSKIQCHTVIKIGDIVQPVYNKSAGELYKVAGVKSNLQGFWITLCTRVDNPGIKPYPYKREKIWVRSEDFEVVSLNEK